MKGKQNEWIQPSPAAAVFPQHLTDCKCNHCNHFSVNWEQWKTKRSWSVPTIRNQMGHRGEPALNRHAIFCQFDEEHDRMRFIDSITTKSFLAAAQPISTLDDHQVDGRGSTLRPAKWLIWSCCSIHECGHRNAVHDASKLPGRSGLRAMMICR